jgi:hypothetical protein
VTSTGTFHLALNNKNSACHLNMKKVFFQPVKMLLFAHKEPASDWYFVGKDLPFSPV